MRRLAVAVALVALWLPSAVLGAMATNTIERRAEVSVGGERAGVTVVLGCDRVQRAKLRVTVTQGSEQGEGRAWGKGKKTVRCETETGRFAVRVEAREEGRFDTGRATACALALTDDDARQWCKEVKLRAS